MKPYTVVGTYEDNMQGYVDHVMAESPEVAAAIAVEKLADEGLLVTAVFDGHLMSLYHDPATEGGHP